MVESRLSKNPNNRSQGGSSATVSIITWAREENVQPVNAVGSGKSKKSAKEIRTAQLENLKRAREAKARYKLEDEQAIARGEVPPSVLRKANNNMPIIMDENNKVKPFDIKQAIWDCNITIPLPQLFQQVPDIYHQFLRLVGAQAISKKREVINKAEKDMDVDSAVTAGINHMVTIDTSDSEIEAKLQAMLCIVGDMQLEFLIDSGAIVSVIIPLEVIDKLGLTAKIRPTNKTLRFGDGEVEPAAGTVKLTLVLSEKVEINHVYSALRRMFTPL